MGRYRLQHAYVREGESLPNDVIEFKPFHVESESEGTALHVWWFVWDE